MISSTLGAPLGGTTVGGHQVFESVASCLMTPPNGGGGAGSWLPSMVVVALGEPKTPVTCGAAPDARMEEDDVHAANVAASTQITLIVQKRRVMPVSL